MIQSVGPILISGPHAANLAVRSMTFSEELSAPFAYTLEVLSDKNSLEAKDFLGEPMTVHLLSLEGDTKRHFSGWVSEFYMLGGILESTLYRIVLRPWLSFLQLSSDCRVYHKKTVPEIVLDVFRRNDMSDFDPQLAGEYETREYCVQYRESDFNFVSRLMEAEGIYYHFRHLEDKHELVLCDAIVQHEPVKEYKEVVYLPVGDRRRFQVEHIHNWQSRHRAVSGGVILTDYDFKAPLAVLNQDVIDPEQHARADHLVFDFPGGYTVPEPTGRAVAKRRLEELKVAHEGTMGESNARGLTVGHSFKLKGHPIAAQNREYLLVSMRGTIESHALESAANLDAGELFRCQFTCAPTSKPFRPPRRTPCPVIHGAQTAVVVGKEGKEIHTDEFGRVKLKFHWDRFAKGEGEECLWVRVAQIWAGTDFGGIHIPRVGQEVLVEFLEGDPDHPIVTGRVYNADHMPPYKLDKNATQSGIKSRSTPGGGPNNFNEIRFEDKKGEEELFIQAEKTQTTLVKGSQSISVGGDQSTSVKGTRDLHVVKKDTQIFDDHRDVMVALTDKLAVGNGREVIVGTLDRNYVDGKKEAEIKGTYAITASDEFLVISDETQLDMMKTLITLQNFESRLRMEAGESSLSASASLTLRSGDHSVTINKAGDIVVTGTKVTVNAASVTITGAQEVILKSDTTVKISAPLVEVTGETMIKLNS
jgi:type VI secretion system secreted protein VgrG